MDGPGGNHFDGSILARYLLPGIVFQSVVIGGGYASGREIVEFGGRWGPLGLWSALGIFAGFSLLAAVFYEFARLTRAYDYRNFMRQLVGPFWLFFDGLYFTFSILVLAIVTAAVGTVLQTTFRLPEGLAILAVAGLLGLFAFYGRGLMERVKTVGTVLLYGGYLLLTAAVLGQRWPFMVAGLTGTAPPLSAGEALLSGLFYVGYNSPLIVTTLFVLDNQTKRRETFAAGLITGLLATVPFLLTYLAVMSFYPDPTVMAAPIPWLAMLQQTGAESLIFIYSLVFFYTLVETGSGLIHSLLDRVDSALQAKGQDPLAPGRRVAAAAAMVAAAALLSRFGLVALVARGYGAMSYGFLLVFILPLLTIGLYRTVAAVASSR